MNRSKLVALLVAASVAFVVALLWGQFGRDDRKPAAAPPVAAVPDKASHPAEPADERAHALETPLQTTAARAPAKDVAPPPAKLEGLVNPSPPVVAPKTPAEWTSKYSKSTLDQMIAARDSIRTELSNRSGPELKQKFASHNSEVVSETGKYTPKPSDDTEIMALHVPEGGQATYRAFLPRSQYPELYALKDEADWLSGAIEKKAAEAALQKPNPK